MAYLIEWHTKQHFFLSKNNEEILQNKWSLSGVHPLGIHCPMMKSASVLRVKHDKQINAGIRVSAGSNIEDRTLH